MTGRNMIYVYQNSDSFVKVTFKMIREQFQSLTNYNAEVIIST